jgi:hypothetical protein
MNIRYGSRRGALITNYVCVGRGHLFGDALCQSIVGTEIDKAISELLIQSVAPMALELSLAVQREIQSRADEAEGVDHGRITRRAVSAAVRT